MMRLMRLILLLFPALCLAVDPLAFEVKVETLVGQPTPEWQWFHPRPAAVPGHGKAGVPLSIVTIQKHLFASDYYSGLFTMTSAKSLCK